MSVAHQPLPPAIIRHLVDRAAELGRNLGFDGLSNSAVAQNLGERIGESLWLGELENAFWVMAYLSFSGDAEASNTPTIRRLIP
jgi:hypothetical protein